MLSILLLGSPQVSLNQQPQDQLRRKNRALLYFLAAQMRGGSAVISRESILACFWPDHERRAAQNILRTMLHELRRDLGQSLGVEDDHLSLSPDSTVDTVRFESGVRSADEETLKSALALYRGEFLAEFNVTVSAEYEDWVAAQRQHYQGLYIRGLTALAQHREAAHDYAAALEALNRALAFDPLQEELQRACLRLHYFNGDRAGAIRRYESLRQQLDEELGVPPSPETRGLYDAIINDTLARPFAPSTPNLALSLPAAPLTPAPLLPFTARSAELQTLNAATRPGQLILIEGEPGIGKTRLAEEFFAARSPAPLILRGLAHELEQGLPYQPMIDALRGLLNQPHWPTLSASLNLPPVWRTEVARLMPDLLADQPPGSTADEARLWEGVNQFLQHLARQQPLLIFLDDLHWADTSTISLLGYLVRRAASPNLLFVATSRPVAARSHLATLLQALTHEGRLTRIGLNALSPSDTQAVAQQLSPAHGQVLADWFQHNAEGNPYFLTELVRYALNNGLLHEDGSLDPKVLAVVPILPATIYNLIQSRLLRLSDPARQMLDVAAVVGREFDFELVQQATGLADGEALNALDELRASALIQPRAGDRYSFDHSLTMEVAYRDRGEARDRALHRRVAATLEALHLHQLESVAGLIAYHYQQGHAPQQAAPYAFRAGQQAAGLAAWAEAIAFYQQALADSQDQAQRAAIYLALGAAYFHNSDLAQATEMYRTSLKVAEAQHDLPAQEAAYFAINQSLLPQARFGEAIALARNLRESGPPEMAMCAEFCWGTALAVESAHPAEAATHLRAAEALLAGPSPFPHQIQLARIKYQLAGALGQQGQISEAVALYKEALALSQQDENALDLLRQIMLYNNLAYQLYLLNDPENAAPYARAGMELARARGSLSHLPYLLSTSGEIALAQHQPDAAEGYFAEGLALAERIPMPERIAGLTANLGLVARERGQTDLARDRFTQALTRADALGAKHLAVRIRIWLAPLLPADQRQPLLQQAQDLAQQGGFQSLLDEISQLRASLA